MVFGVKSILCHSNVLNLYRKYRLHCLPVYFSDVAWGSFSPLAILLQEKQVDHVFFTSVSFWFAETLHILNIQDIGFELMLGRI